MALLTAGIIAGAAPAGATIENLKSFKQAYPGKDAKAYSCKVCHNGVMGTKDNLNAYGAALKAFKAPLPADAKRLTAEDYKAFDAADTDEDGASNGAEVAAGTDPMDAASVTSAQGHDDNHEHGHPPMDEDGRAEPKGGR